MECQEHFFPCYFNPLILESHDILPLSHGEAHASHMHECVHTPKDTSMYHMHSLVHRNAQVDIVQARTCHTHEQHEYLQHLYTL